MGASLGSARAIGLWPALDADGHGDLSTRSAAAAPDGAARRRGYSYLQATCLRLIDALHPGFSASARPETRLKLLMLAYEAAGLAGDDYARSKAFGAVRWASIALSDDVSQGWSRHDAEAFALADAYRLWRQISHP